MKFFTECGNPVQDTVLDCSITQISDIARTCLNNMRERGASILEIRAATLFLSGVVECQGSDTVLTMQAAMSPSRRNV